MDKWNNFLNEVRDSKKKKRLHEISEKELKRSGLFKYVKKYNPDVDQLKSIFAGKGDRIIVPLERTAESMSDSRDLTMLKYINQLRNKGWTIDLTEPFGYATKIVYSKVGDEFYQNKKRVKIGPLIIELGEEAKEFWQKNNKFYTTKENALYFSSTYVIIVSRKPLDILRMSDHDGWSSCHSVGASYYKCAISEAVVGGAIAYVVNKESLKEVDLNADEIFEDSKRNIDGVSPLSRIRIRRFTYRDDLEIGIPETRVYGQGMPDFYKKLSSFLKKEQSEEIEEIKNIAEDNPGILSIEDWTMFGGSYVDTSVETLFQSFFGSTLKFSGYSSEKDNFNIEQEYSLQRISSQADEYVAETNNYLAPIASIWADVEDSDDEDDGYSVNFGGLINVELSVSDDDKQRVLRNFKTGNTYSIVKEMYNLDSEYGNFDPYDIEVYAPEGNELRFTLTFRSVDYTSDLDGLQDFGDEVKRIYRSRETLKEDLRFALEKIGFLNTPEEIQEVLEGLKTNLGAFKFQETNNFITLLRKDLLFLMNNVFKQAEYLVSQAHSKGLKEIEIITFYDILEKRIYEASVDFRGNYSKSLSGFTLSLVDAYMGRKTFLDPNPELFATSNMVRPQEVGPKDEEYLDYVNVVAEIIPPVSTSQGTFTKFELKIKFTKPKEIGEEKIEIYKAFYRFAKFINDNEENIKNSAKSFVKRAIELSLEEFKNLIKTTTIKERKNIKKKIFMFDDYTWRIVK